MARVSIEDCLEHVDNRFALVTIAAHRARQLMEGDDILVGSKNKEAVTALREIADGYVVGKGSNTVDEASPTNPEPTESKPAEKRIEVTAETDVNTLL